MVVLFSASPVGYSECWSVRRGLSKMSDGQGTVVPRGDEIGSASNDFRGIVARTTRSLAIILNFEMISCPCILDSLLDLNAIDRTTLSDWSAEVCAVWPAGDA